VLANAPLGEGAWNAHLPLIGVTDAMGRQACTRKDLRGSLNTAILFLG
jgi:hypothetical protein